MPDLLPENFGTETLQPPVMILREQADNLSKRTGGLVLGRVLTQKLSHGSFGHRFILEVPTLDDYAYTLFVVTHPPVLLYPLNLRSEVLQGENVDTQVEDPKRFEDALRNFFAHPQVGRIVAVLKAQALAAGGTSA